MKNEWRIAIRKARWEHALEALRVMDEEGQHEAATRLRHEMKLLEPYWNKPGVTKEQAVAAFYEART